MSTSLLCLLGLHKWRALPAEEVEKRLGYVPLTFLPGVWVHRCDRCEKEIKRPYM
jgi:hypothetical protein